MKKSFKIILITIISVALLTGITFLINPFLFWHIGVPYKTQTIIFKNRKDPLSTIVFQMQDSGAFGYNRRIVKVRQGIIWDSINNIDTSLLNHDNWERVNIDVNELGLKYP